MDYTDSLALTMAHLRQQGYTQDLNLPVTFPGFEGMLVSDALVVDAHTAELEARLHLPVK